MFKNLNNTSSESIETPLGPIEFTMSQRDRNGIPEHTAIAHHQETGAMALSIGKSMDGDSSERMVSANAAYDLCVTVQSLMKMNREASA